MQRKKKLTIYALMFLLVAMILVGLAPQDTHAASKKSKALKAYKEYLAKDKILWGNTKVDSEEISFFIKDMDGDKVPELILSCVAGSASDGYERILSYNKKKVKEVLVATRGSFTYYPSKHVVKERITGWNGIDETRWYKITKGKAKFVAEKTINSNTSKPETYYTVNSKSVTKAQYNKQIKKLQGKKLKESWKKNTSVNRKKYIK